jgi:hypothetical protein
VESAGKARLLILGFQQTVPGFIVMFTLQVALTSGSPLLIAERRRGRDRIASGGNRHGGSPWR